MPNLITRETTTKDTNKNNNNTDSRTTHHRHHDNTKTPPIVKTKTSKTPLTPNTKTHNHYELNGVCLGCELK
jgi:hypothetical protein